MKTNLRERLIMYQSVIRPKVHFAPEFSFKLEFLHVCAWIDLNQATSHSSLSQKEKKTVRIEMQ